jgi:hypothetical protein
VNAADILGGIVSDIDVKGTTTIDAPDADVRDITFYTIVTDKGRADVILHVDHNGYYGGHLNDPTEVESIPISAQEPE